MRFDDDLSIKGKGSGKRGGTDRTGALGDGLSLNVTASRERKNLIWHFFL